MRRAARRASSRPVAAGAVLVTVLLVAVATAGADPDATTGTSTSTSSSSTTTTQPPAPDDGSLIVLPRAPVVIDDDPRVDPALAAVGVDSDDYRQAISDFLDTFNQLKDVVARHDDAVGRFNTAVSNLSDLLTAHDRLQGQVNSANRRKDKAQAHLDDTRQKLKSLAVDQYIHGGLADDLDGVLDPARADDIGQQRVMVESVHHDQLVDAQLTAQVLDQQTGLAATYGAELDDVNRRQAVEQANRDKAAADRDEADKERTALLPQLSQRKQAVADARLTAGVTDLDFTLVVFNAYVRAAREMAVEQPDCGLRWSALAGIGKTESHHGTYDGSSVDANGNETQPIYGVSLDGTNGNAAIGDTDGGLLDGDPNGDRAMGPMQFIPSTWLRVERDGDGDGNADPQNYYDAALTAAAYLCRKGPGLDTDDGLRRAFRSYNNDDSYVELVLKRTHYYDRVVIPSVDAPTPGDLFAVPLPPATTTTTKKPSTTTVPPRKVDSSTSTSTATSEAAAATD
jgi:membrane-bound lytic murein transglycosylase B